MSYYNECPNCEGDVLDCIDDNGTLGCPKCGWKEYEEK